MKYRVKIPFKDREGKRWWAGDTFETDDPKRALSLQQRQIIGGALPEPKAEEPPAQEAEYPIPLPGGYYQLPDGTKVRGKKAAAEAMKGGETDGTT